MANLARQNGAVLTHYYQRSIDSLGDTDIGYDFDFGNDGDAIPNIFGKELEVVKVVSNQGSSKKGFGNYVIVKPVGSDHAYRLSHLNDKGLSGLSVGSKIGASDTIAYQGNTGRSTGPHLDLRVLQNGEGIISDPSVRDDIFFRELGLK